MKQEQVKLVQASFEKIKPVADQFADLFYRRLFELDPKLKNLFQGDMPEQGKKLMAVLATAVNGLENLVRLTPVIQELGRRHIGYGVTARDYDTVEEALVWTLEQGLGDTFSDEIEEAWLEAYEILASVMKEAAEAA